MSKVRYGFVSNSSSSSFVCDLCGETHSGLDLSIRDIGGFICENDHTICCQELRDPTLEECHDFLRKYYDDADDWEKRVIENSCAEDINNHEELLNILSDYEFNHNAPEVSCPICSMQEICERDLKVYLRTLSNIPEGEVLAVIKESNRRRRKLYDNEYVDYVLEKLNVVKSDMVAHIKRSFNSYSDFIEFKGERDG